MCVCVCVCACVCVCERQNHYLLLTQSLEKNTLLKVNILTKDCELFSTHKATWDNTRVVYKQHLYSYREYTVKGISLTKHT